MSSDSPEPQQVNLCTETGALSRGRQLNRSPETQPISPSTQVPLQFVHVPNSQNVQTMMPRLSHRTPSVPDFTSYRVHHHQNPIQSISHPHLSGEILRNAAGTDPMEQFEERLRRAQLTVSQNRAIDLAFVTRMRSRSTPSRGYAAHHRGNRTEEEMRNSALRLQRDVLRYEIRHTNNGDDTDGNAELNYPSDGIIQSDLMPPAPAPIEQSTIVEQSNSSPKTPLSCAETNNTQLHKRNLSSVSSSSPTHRIPSPPPLPPPSSERERLVQREREARSETERARRRHLALQRERQLEENPTIDHEESADVSIRNNDRPTSVGSLEVVETGVTFLCDDDADNHAVGSMSNEMQFCDIEHGLAHNTQVAAHSNLPQPSVHLDETQDVSLGLSNHAAAENMLVHHTTNSTSNASVGSTSHISGISEPPPLPPPATERERLVLREREARLETERARRRHIALLREQGFQQHEEIDSFDVVESVEDFSVLQDGDATAMDQVELIREGGTNNNLSYTMERFLETIGEEDRNALTAVGLSPNEGDIINADATPLPYTMELFLSENVAVEGSGDDIRGIVTCDAEDIPIESETVQDVAVVDHSLIEDSSDSDSIGSNESVDILSEHAVPPDDSNTASIGDNNSYIDMPHLGSSASDIDQELPRELSPNIAASRHADSRTTNREILQLSASPLHQAGQQEADLNSDLNDGISPLHQSIDDFTQLSESVFAPQMPQLTEEGVAQLVEVDHASIGNTPPQSVRSEPSESSLPDLVQDRGFSVVTQTTAMESVTETSQASVNDTNRNHVGQLSSDSADVIRIGAVCSSYTMREDDSVDITLAALRASSTSVEAIPSIASVIDSSSGSHVLSNPSSSDLHSSARSSALDSYVSSNEESRILSLTEEGVVAMEEIDQASIGNVPPRSVRDESIISESSVLGRGQRRFQSAPRDTLTASASVEAMPSVNSVHSMSQDSVDAMPSEYNGNSLLEGSNETGDEDLMVCHTSDMASIEALPSVISEDNNFVSLTRHESNETEDEDLMVYQSSDRASSTSIEALPTDDDNSSIDDSVHSPPSDTDRLDYGATRLNGLHHGSLEEHLVNSHHGERTPLLPITQTNATSNGTLQAARQNNSWGGK
ncbi:hypothetical protein ACHAXN_004406 [Cyclotella atomus]